MTGETDSVTRIVGPVVQRQVLGKAGANDQAQAHRNKASDPAINLWEMERV